MSFTKNKYDSCYLSQQQENNKSIFDYVIDTTMYINKNECDNYTPPFLTYISSGIKTRNVDLENELKGINKPSSKCNACKYTPDDQSISDNSKSFPSNKYKELPLNKELKHECKPEFNPLKNGYVKRM